MLKNSNLKAVICASLLVLGCVPARTEAVTTKSLLAGVVGLTALGASQAGPIFGWLVGATTRAVGYGVLAGAAAGAVTATGGALVGLAGTGAVASAVSGGISSMLTAGAGAGLGAVGATGAIASGTAAVVSSSAAATTAVLGTGYLAAVGGTLTSVFTSVEFFATSLQILATALPTP